MMQPELLPAAESTRETLHQATQGASWCYKQQVRIIIITLDIESLSSQANFQHD